jgi:aspartokinase
MSVSRLTHKYIREHPSVQDCLERGLINYSALAREICTTNQIDSFDAVLVACRRYFQKKRSHVSREQKILALVKKSKVRVRNKILVASIEKSKGLDKALEIQNFVKKEKGDFNLIEGEDVFTIITNSDYLPILKKTFTSGVLKVSSGLAQITMVFGETLEMTPGVLSYIYRMFSDYDINIREEMSCWRDVMVVVEEKDVAKVMQMLNFD